MLFPWEKDANVDTPDFSVELPDGVPIPTLATEPTADRTPVQYPYFVRRTKSDNLPVYNVTKRGGSLQITTINHVEGNPRVFAPWG